jgi:hypothetical protein
MLDPCQLLPIRRPHVGFIQGDADYISTLYQNWKHIFPEMKLCGLVPTFYIHVSVSNLYIQYILMISPPQTDPVNIKIAHRYMNV